MTGDELRALAEIRGLAGAGRFVLSAHARQRMDGRGVRVPDVQRALASATVCRDQRDDATRAGDWAVTGPDLDGDTLTCAVVLEGTVRVLTVF